MWKNITIALGSLIIGSWIGYLLVFYTSLPSKINRIYISFTTFGQQSMSSKQVIGFLPYWLLDKANTDYYPYINQLSYFALRVDGDGSILKLVNAVQEEPGWNALHSGKVDPFFTQARVKHIPLSLTIDSGDIAVINSLVANPIMHADKLISDVHPLLATYHFSDLNLDIEYTTDTSASARHNFTKFVGEVRKKLSPKITLTIEISSTDSILPKLIDVASISKIADYIVIMAYDYHSPDSFVTGPVAPLAGAGMESEYDVTTAVTKALKVIPPFKLILGIPLYGYEWEMIGQYPRMAVIPGSGVLASNRRSELLESTCATCSALFDTDAQESYLFYFSDDSNSNHILFFPTQQSTQSKIELANTANLGGIALWALGYEGNMILNPLRQYLNH